MVGEVLIDLKMYLFENLKMYFREPASQFDNQVCLQYGFFRTFDNSNGQLDNIPASLQIKPNPASQNVTVSLINSKDGIQNVILYDVNGKIVLEQNVKSNVKTLFLNTQHLPDGFYFVRVSSENEIFNSKLVITK